MSTSKDTIRSTMSANRAAPGNNARVRTRGRALNRVLVLLALCTLGLLTSASAAQAKIVSNETTSYPWSGFVSCANGGAGEELSGWIESHDLITSTDNDHLDSYQLQLQPHGSLVGSITGDSYQLTGVMRAAYKDIARAASTPGRACTATS